ncbi:hypothetical protein SASPL_118400 [Salvia splendens]|uniref:Uncharacterized protein n=1 Tax=Salvia splendens TaxID=180675 RepID=A0A8X8ZZ33_SALSN|nr:hypothetical protein SASPL_118400 [Salvia splendens]
MFGYWTSVVFDFILVTDLRIVEVYVSDFCNVYSGIKIRFSLVDRSMCTGLEKSNSNSCTAQMKDLNNLSVETEGSLSSLLEFAANNDIESFKRLIEVDLSVVDEAGL